MTRRVVAIIACAMLVFGFVACSKEEPVTPTAGQGGVPEGHPPLPQGEGEPVVGPIGETETIVPEFVAGQWSAVVLIIEDKAAGKSSEADVKLNSEYTIPGSTVKIKVGDFLPDFKMTGPMITSTTNEMNNPAVKVTVTDGETEVFDGWLYSKFPAIHPFQHEKYGLTLKDAKAAKKK